jgi:DNA (cytosine-5)-methyltransferase 1
MMKKSVYKIVDLFSGAGGLSLGFEHPESLNGLGNLGYTNIGYSTQAFKTILAIDQYEHASETFSLNFDSEIKNENISNIDTFSDWGDADIVIGGPPCQGFSNLNSTKTEDLDDDRNTLWEEFMRAVEEIDPAVFLVENVPRFLNTKNAVNAVEKAEDIGYTTVVDCLSTEKYGVPQKRRRGFILGSKLGIPFFPSPTGDEIKTVKDAIGDLPAEPTNEDLHVGRNITERSKKRMEAVPPGGNRFDLPEHLLNDCWKDHENGSTDVYGRLWWDEPSVTIRTEFVKPEKGRYLHPEQNRSITMREGARLQTFPDDFEFNNSYKKHVTQLIGNATPPKLSYHLGLAIKAHLEGVDSSFIEDPDSNHPSLRKSEQIDGDTLEEYRLPPAKVPAGD